MVLKTKQVFVALAVVLCCSRVRAEEYGLRDLPCPDNDDIYPCFCTVLPNFGMEMDCSNVTSSEELAAIFSLDFSFKDFESLIIDDNYDIKTIRKGDLGQASFKKVSIVGGILDTVVKNAFSNSYDTLTDMEITFTKLAIFPFSEINQFTNLILLNFENNQLVGFPVISSTSLRALYLGFNPLGEISPSALVNLPSLTSIGLHSTELTLVSPGTFSGLPLLQDVHLEMNALMTLQAGSIELQTSSNLVHLNDNSLTYIAENALTGLTGELWVQDNQLIELAERVFKPLMDNNVQLYAARNPLTCGCEIAWIVINANYMNRLVDDTTCEDGELVSDLDPGLFIAIC